MTKILFALLLLAAPLGAEDAAKPEPAPERWHFFFNYDYFFPQNAGRGLNDQLNTLSTKLIAQGYGSVQTRDTTQGAAGARFGAFHAFDRKTDLGLSLGYIVGPTMNSDFEAAGGPGPGGITINRDVIFLRYLAEGRVNFPLDKRWTFSMGTGMGLATGRVEQTCDQSGTVACPIGATRRTWTGFTWEFSPAIKYRLSAADIRFGARYAGFPEFDGNDQIARIDWITYGVFAGASF